MSGGSPFSRISRLVDDHLRPYTVMEGLSLSEEEEKDILIALSKVLREIQLWISQLDSSSDSDLGTHSTSEREVLNEVNLNSKEGYLLGKIIGDLMIFLVAESQHVQHLTCNVLSAISELLCPYGKEWRSFVKSLFVCIKMSISTILAYSSIPTSLMEEHSINPENYILHVELKLQHAKWSTVAGLLKVLRAIFKFVKQDIGDQKVHFYLSFLNSFVLHTPWNLMDDACGGQSDTETDVRAQKFIFLGYFAQLLCSLVEQLDHTNACCHSVHRNPLLSSIIDLIPSLLHWCLDKQEEHADAGISLYFKHKLLMLMIRLSCHRLEHSILILWLELLNKYFQDALLERMDVLDSAQVDSLEGSPFSARMFNEKVQGLHMFHLKRQAIFLLLRCSLSLIDNEGENDQLCAKSCLTLDLGESSHKQGLTLLCKWLHANLKDDTYSDSKLYMEKCVHFSSSFLQLYMHEDDLLFKVLLQLLGFPIPGCQKCEEVKGTNQGLNEDILFHLSNLFNPISLFHLFLSEIQYDHQVLLDYLISKDVGISCAEYLLRCLRWISNSWQVFMGFPNTWHLEQWPSVKKRKAYDEKLNFHGDTSYTFSEKEGCLLSPKKCNKEQRKYGNKIHGTRVKPFEKAKLCLLSLKYSVESLHQKNLFPYNPKVLLKRLTEFEEQCCESEIK